MASLLIPSTSHLGSDDSVSLPTPTTAPYKPRISRSTGQCPAYLVNASVTYCGQNQVYVFGGFDQYTDEVYNHVFRLDLTTLTWSLVDNYGDIPGVRMGHTATLWQGDKLLVFGGENEHREYLSDLIIFDLKTAVWTKPTVQGPTPQGRTRHAAVLHDNKLFILGGVTGRSNFAARDICFLDLNSFTWSRSWQFVGRYDHSAFVWDDRIWVFGGLSEDMDKTDDLWWLDIKNNPSFDRAPRYFQATGDYPDSYSNGQNSPALTPPVQTPRHAANSRLLQVQSASPFRSAGRHNSTPGIYALKSTRGPTTPIQADGVHFHTYSHGTIIDIQTPAASSASNLCKIGALDLQTFRWQKLSNDDHDFLFPGHRWLYCVLDHETSKVWLLGCSTAHDDNVAALADGADGEAVINGVMDIDLRHYGFLGDHTPASPTTNTSIPTSLHPTSTTGFLRHPESQGLGLDLSKLFDQPPETGSGSDFIITAITIGDEFEDMISTSGTENLAASSPKQQPSMDVEESMAYSPPRSACASTAATSTPSPSPLPPTQVALPSASPPPASKPIHVHKLILLARWPHFQRLFHSQMAEFHTNSLHIPEPYSVVKRFLFYLYTDSIHLPYPHASTDEPSRISDTAGLLVLANLYDVPRLRHLCVHRLVKELGIGNACLIWHCAGLANEGWLRKRAARFCMTHWGRVVRTSGFLRLPRSALVQLSQEVDTEGQIVCGDEAEIIQTARYTNENHPSPMLEPDHVPSVNHDHQLRSRIYHPATAQSHTDLSDLPNLMSEPISELDDEEEDDDVGASSEADADERMDEDETEEEDDANN